MKLQQLNISVCCSYIRAPVGWTKSGAAAALTRAGGAGAFFATLLCFVLVRHGSFEAP
jgi:hypothetical protein